MGSMCGRREIILSVLQSAQTTYGAHLWAVKRPDHEADNSSLSSAEVRTARTSISTPLYAFKAALTKEHGTFSFNLSNASVNDAQTI
jgi:hypothetical protein